MATKDALLLFLSSLEKKTYYQVLRIAREADPAAVKAAFHDFALLYHPDRYVDSPEEVREAATEIFKRGVEAYRCVSRRSTRERYDRAVARGKVRMDAALPSTRPPPPVMRTLEMIAQTPRAKQRADKADRLIAVGRLDEARVQLVGACHDEPGNEELAERLQFLYSALALEPP
jgi:curved DNA-binding protein CbpA